MNDSKREKKQAETPDRRRGGLVLDLDPATLRGAERLIADHARGTLETVLAGLVADMAEAWERPGSWEARAVCGWLESHPWPKAKETVRDDDDFEEGGAL